MHKRSPYAGTHRRLVLGIDLGTTFSGVSYAILDPGVVPEIRGINRFPAQGTVGANCKIPTIVYYDTHGLPRAFGAEALQQDIIEQAEDQGWTKVEWFKLHLRPQSMTSSADHSLPSLPRHKIAQDVFADFLGYLFRCASTYIQETHSVLVWNSVKKHVDFVLSHPNGWEGLQQKLMRNAAVAAGLITDDQVGHARLRFVTEGEASLNFCINQGLTTAAMQKGEGVIIVDAGGGTVDISAYKVALKTWCFEEIASAKCLFQGSTFVTRRAEDFLQEEFEGSRYAELVSEMVETFDTSTKLTFRGSTVPAFIKFGRLLDNDPERNVRQGRLTIQGSRMEKFFKPSFDAIMDAILAQKEEAKKRKPISVVYLVGGFAASDWLFRSLHEELRSLGLVVSRPDTHMNKAVADGAVSFYLDQFVKTRVAKITYGVGCQTLYQSSLPDHKARHLDIVVGVDGQPRLPKSFSVLLSRGTAVTEEKEFRRAYVSSTASVAELNVVRCAVTGFYGDFVAPNWTDIRPSLFRIVCMVNANMASAPKKHLHGKKGWYYEIEFEIILTFGAPELKAQVCWVVDGREIRGPATIVYDD